VNCVRVGFAGCKLLAPRVLLVATQSGGVGGVEGDPDGLMTELRQRYETDVVIGPRLFVVDSTDSSSADMTSLKRAIAAIKQFVCEVRARSPLASL